MKMLQYAGTVAAAAAAGVLVGEMQLAMGHELLQDCLSLQQLLSEKCCELLVVLMTGC
jgi:hypothetical protein